MKNKCKFKRNKEKEYVSVHENRVEKKPIYLFLAVIMVIIIIFGLKIFFSFN